MTTNVSDVEPAAVDWVTRVRRRLLPSLHRVTEAFGGYALCTTDPLAYVGTVQRSLQQFRDDLRTMEFSPEPVASLKCHRDGRLSAGSWVHRRSLLSDRQLHVTVFQNGRNTVDVYAHHEYSWVTHPYRHYTASGWDSAEGVRRMRSRLSDYSIPFRLG